MRLLLGFLIAFSSLQGLARAEAGRQRPGPSSSVEQTAAWKFSAYFFSPEFRYERGSDLDLSYISYIGYGIGLRHLNLGLVLETFRGTTSSGNQALSIDREHRDWLLSGRYFFWSRSSTVGNFGCFLAGGVGFYNETIRTTLNGNVTQDNGNRESLAAAGLGVEADFSLTPRFAFTMGAEVRILASKNFDPNPEPTGLARIGLSF